MWGAGCGQRAPSLSSPPPPPLREDRAMATSDLLHQPGRPGPITRPVPAGTDPLPVPITEPVPLSCSPRGRSGGTRGGEGRMRSRVGQGSGGRLPWRRRLPPARLARSRSPRLVERGEGAGTVPRASAARGSRKNKGYSADETGKVDRFLQPEKKKGAYLCMGNKIYEDYGKETKMKKRMELSKQICKDRFDAFVSGELITAVRHLKFCMMIIEQNEFPNKVQEEFSEIPGRDHVPCCKYSTDSDHFIVIPGFFEKPRGDMSKLSILG
ncbi:uncharacterized protein LOC113966639 [Neopelma chrysocephalum]|uniref:uncharacterized protein LOC113966639 n=1 Tax=Neopelma chrysocephalum TaxID=114329 RepID=UPI000FCD26D9|nr:uncharacterized protein LOC113966639 [Neopelma chrysocephalum]